MEFIRKYPKIYVHSSLNEMVRGDVIYLWGNNYLIVSLNFMGKICRMTGIELETNTNKNYLLEINVKYLVWAINSLCYLMLERAYGIQEGRLFHNSNALYDNSTLPNYHLHTIQEEIEKENEKSIIQNKNINRKRMASI